MSDRLTLIREAVAKDGMNLEDAYADRAWLLSKYDLATAALEAIKANSAPEAVSLSTKNRIRAFYAIACQALAGPE